MPSRTDNLLHFSPQRKPRLSLRNIRPKREVRSSENDETLLKIRFPELPATVAHIKEKLRRIGDVLHQILAEPFFGPLPNITEEDTPPDGLTTSLRKRGVVSLVSDQVRLKTGRALKTKSESPKAETSSAIIGRENISPGLEAMLLDFLDTVGGEVRVISVDLNETEIVWRNEDLLIEFTITPQGVVLSDTDDNALHRKVAKVLAALNQSWLVAALYHHEIQASRAA